MNAAAGFARAVERLGVTVSLEAWQGHATGDYVHPHYNAPDPEDPDYPTSGAAPGDSYGAAQSVQAIVQPAKGDEAERLVHTVWGETVLVSLWAFFPQSVTPTPRDRVTCSGTAYWVAKLETHEVAGEVVYRKALLTEVVG